MYEEEGKPLGQILRQKELSSKFKIYCERNVSRYLKDEKRKSDIEWRVQETKRSLSQL
jgi:hypothetical protein